MIAERIHKHHSEVGKRGFQKRFGKLMKIFGFGESTAEGQGGAAGAATATGSAPTPEREVLGTTMRVVNDSARVKDLIQVHTWTPIDVLRDAPAQFYCLDMENEGIGPVVNWVREAINIAFDENRRIPVIYAIGPNQPLTDEELDRVHDELASLGAHFFKRPDYKASFVDAMKSLRDGLAKQYGMLQRMESRRHNENAPEPVASNR